MAAEYSMSNPEKVVGEEAFQVQLLKKVLADAADAFKTFPVTICVVWKMLPKKLKYHEFG